jgi:mannitol-specific phosphotransferase system IIBC component
MYTKICAALVASFMLAAPLVAYGATAEKKLTAQQQKMKDCAAKWKDEKAQKKVKGRAEYNKFMSGCLKKT